ncbi:6-phosphogluconolactonase [Thiobacillus denitrificans]|uniref:6-phosphogluconolactonase n=1 Tax=Thiobacillus denitrificans TaxID=36861 RepID=UPI00037A7D0F|nr:6-phosphogluconolactonase [Thiobacillus denitrificans]
MATQWRMFADGNALVRALADALCAEAAAAVAARGTFHLVLAGGTTPRALYTELARRGAGDARWHIWYGDERCLPADHPERNSAMAEAAWLAASNIPEEQRRPIPAEFRAGEAAAVYADWLARVGDFDVVLLGMGEDGHTASLFPGHDWGAETDSPDALAVFDAPKPPPERVSLSVARLSRSQRVWFVVTGSGKREALLHWRQGAKLPVSGVRGGLETVAWLDQDAWSTAK